MLAESDRFEKLQKLLKPDSIVHQKALLTLQHGFLLYSLNYISRHVDH